MQRRTEYAIGDGVHRVELNGDGDTLTAVVDEQRYAVTVLPSAPGHVTLDVDGQRVRAYVTQDQDVLYVAVGGRVWTLTAPTQSGAKPRRAARASGSLVATMPGLVLDVLVQPDDMVAKGDPLVLLEAMKMELRITAPHAGRIARVHCRAGAVVERGQLLVEVIERGAADT